MSINYPKIPVDAFLENSARKYPSRTALVFYGNRITYAALDRAASQLANALQHLNIKIGDRVGLMLPNVPQFVISYYSVLRIGGTVVALNPMNEEDELNRQINDSAAETIIILDRFLNKTRGTSFASNVEEIVVTAAEDYLPWTKKMMSRLGPRRHRAHGFRSFQKLLREHPPSPRRVEINPLEDLAVIQYTGGTTGRPKGAMLTHFNLVANAIQTHHWLRGWGYSHRPQPSGHPVVLGAIPFFHIYGMTVAMNEAIHAGSTIVLVPQPEGRAMIEAIERYKATHLPATPAMYKSVLEQPSLDKRQLRSLAYCVSGGNPIDPETKARFRDVSGAEFYEGYGLTEASPVTHCTTLINEVPESSYIGIPFPDTEARVVDLLRGEENMPFGEPGELVVRGPQVMKGYLGQSEETERTLRDGWLYTGDVAVMDEQGFFYLVDRKQDRVVVHGHTIWPRKVEEVLLKHPQVESAVVVGVSDAMRCATDLHAFVILKNSARGKVGQKELKEYCREVLQQYQTPEKIEIVKELPLTPLGRISRTALRQRLERGSSP